MNSSDNLCNNLTSDEQTIAPLTIPSVEDERTAQTQQYSHEIAETTQRKANEMIELFKAFQRYKRMTETNHVMPVPKVKNSRKRHKIMMKALHPHMHKQKNDKYSEKLDELAKQSTKLLESGDKETLLNESNISNDNENNPSQDAECSGKLEASISCNKLLKALRRAGKRVKTTNETLEGAREITSINVTTERTNSLLGANEAEPTPRWNSKYSATITDKWTTCMHPIVDELSVQNSYTTPEPFGLPKQQDALFHSSKNEFCNTEEGQMDEPEGYQTLQHFRNQPIIRNQHSLEQSGKDKPTAAEERDNGLTSLLARSKNETSATKTQMKFDQESIDKTCEATERRPSRQLGRHLKRRHSESVINRNRERG